MLYFPFFTFSNVSIDGTAVIKLIGIFGCAPQTFSQSQRFPIYVMKGGWIRTLIHHLYDGDIFTYTKAAIFTCNTCAVSSYKLTKNIKRVCPFTVGHVINWFYALHQSNTPFLEPLLNIILCVSYSNMWK